MNMAEPENTTRRIVDKRVGKGVTLRGSLWERLNKVAEDRDTTVSRVIESLVEGGLSRVHDSTKMADTPAFRGSAIFRDRQETDHEE